jgi:hypothetical protein
MSYSVKALDPLSPAALIMCDLSLLGAPIPRQWRE